MGSEAQSQRGVSITCAREHESDEQCPRLAETREEFASVERAHVSEADSNAQGAREGRAPWAPRLSPGWFEVQPERETDLTRWRGPDVVVRRGVPPVRGAV